MTVTPTRREQVTFSNPVIAPIEEWVVSQHSLPTFNRITQLSGKRVWVRASSSYYESLRQLNWLFRELGLPPIYIETVPEYLQDGDLLEMVAVGIIPLTVTDSFKGRIWLGMISGLRAHKLIPLRDNYAAPGPAQQQSRTAQGSQRLSGRCRQAHPLQRHGFAPSAGAQRPDEQHTGAGSAGQAVDHPQGAGAAGRQVPAGLADAGGAGLQGVGAQCQHPFRTGAVGIMQLLPSTGGEVGIRGARLASLEGNVRRLAAICG